MVPEDLLSFIIIYSSEKEFRLNLCILSMPATESKEIRVNY